MTYAILNASTITAHGTAANTFCVGNDSRLSDARTPTAHAVTHATGQPDETTGSLTVTGADWGDAGAPTLVNGENDLLFYSTDGTTVKAVAGWNKAA